MKTCPLLAALLLVTFIFVLPAGAQPAAAAAKTHQGDGWAILAPGDWSPFAAAPPPVVVFLVGDGRAGVPMVDGTLSAVKAGLLIERFPAGKRTVKQRVEDELKLLKTSGKFRPIAEPAVKEITLADGTAATVVDAAFVRLENGRVSTQTKVYAADAAGRHLVATSFLTCSRPGLRSVRAMGLTALLHAFAASMVLDPSALDTLALALDETGDRPAAVQAVEKALKLRPNDPDLAARLKSLQ